MLRHQLTHQPIHCLSSCPHHLLVACSLRLWSLWAQDKLLLQYLCHISFRFLHSLHPYKLVKTKKQSNKQTKPSSLDCWLRCCLRWLHTNCLLGIFMADAYPQIMPGNCRRPCKMAWTKTISGAIVTSKHCKHLSSCAWEHSCTGDFPCECSCRVMYSSQVVFGGYRFRFRSTYSFPGWDESSFVCLRARRL